MKTKAKWVFSILGLITIAALVIPTMIPCNADGSDCHKEKVKNYEGRELPIQFKCQ